MNRFLSLALCLSAASSSAPAEASPGVVMLRSPGGPVIEILGPAGNSMGKAADTAAAREAARRLVHPNVPRAVRRAAQAAVRRQKP